MKNKIKLLSLISALAIGATMTLTACKDTGVGDHDHVWDEGTVTTESTCSKEGVKTYNCKVEGCEQTKTEPIAKIAHSWNGGEVTKQAKCNEEGVKTYTCTVEGCGKTKEEAIEKTAHRYDEGEITRTPDFLSKGVKTFTCLDCELQKTESVEAHADFSEQFYTTMTEQNNWYYGSTTSFGAADFVQIEEAEGGVWKSGEIEIGKGYVCGDNAAIAYKFAQALPEMIQTNVSISFVGEESATRFNAYLFINGECVETVEENSKEWSYETEEAIDIAQDDIFCIVFKNAGEGKAGGNLSITFTAPCVHVWDNGEITKTATCTEEGVKEYGCLYCDEKITETVEMIPHKYNNGEVTTEPTETSDGEKTYTCELCGGTKTEVIPATGSGKFEGASFAEDYELNESGEFAGWQVGVIDYHWSSETFDFTKISVHNENGDAYHSNDPWIDIKGDWMAVNGMMGFAYHFTSAANVKVQFNLHAVSENGKFSLRWAIKDKDGNIKNTDGKAQWYGDGHDIEFDQDISVVAGDVLYLLVNKDDGGDQNNFDLTLTDKDKQPEPEPEFEGADFTEDFTSETQDGAWSYGYVDYHWGEETFDFHKSETFEDGAWKAENVQIKNDWIDAGGMATIAYTAFSDINVKALIAFVGGTDGTRISIRIGVKNSAGVLYGNPTYDDGGKVSKDLNLEKTYELKAGDTIYFIFSNEANQDGCWPNGNLDIKLIADGQEQPEPEPEFEGANFAEDFTLENQDGAWGYGYMADPWDDNRHFEACTQKTDDAWIFNDGDFNKVEIKSDWIAVNKETTISYTATAAISAKIRVEFDGTDAETLMGIRIFALEGGKLVEKAFNNTKNEEGKQVVEISCDFEAGETIYVMFSVENWSAATSGELGITITEA